MARQISITDTKDDFYRLAAAVEAGEEIVITKNGTPKAKMIAFAPKAEEATKKHKGG
jgi:prevent-host-death family protein